MIELSLFAIGTVMVAIWIIIQLVSWQTNTAPMPLSAGRPIATEKDRELRLEAVRIIQSLVRKGYSLKDIYKYADTLPNRLLVRIIKEVAILHVPRVAVKE